MKFSIRGAMFALVALTLFSEVLLTQQMPGQGQHLRFDSSGNQQAAPQLFQRMF